MKRSFFYLLGLFALASAGCRQAPIEALRPIDPPNAQPVVAPIVAAPSEGAQPAALVSALAAPEPKLHRLPLGERLLREAAARPALAVRLAQLRKAVRKHRVSVVRTRQVLASPVGASFCELLLSGEGLAVSVCEFADSGAAREGSDRSRRLFDALAPGRKLIARENSLLTLSAPASADAEREAQQIARVFNTLMPIAVSR